MPRQFKKETHEQMNLILTKEVMQQFRLQAEQLGTDRTGYIKLIISLDASAQIISKLKDEK